MDDRVYFFLLLPLFSFCNFFPSPDHSSASPHQFRSLITSRHCRLSLVKNLSFGKFGFVLLGAVIAILRPPQTPFRMPKKSKWSTCSFPLVMDIDHLTSCQMKWQFDRRSYTNISYLDQFLLLYLETTNTRETQAHVARGVPYCGYSSAHAVVRLTVLPQRIKTLWWEKCTYNVIRFIHIVSLTATRGRCNIHNWVCTRYPVLTISDVSPTDSCKGWRW